MNRFIDRLKLLFLGIFAVSCVAVWTYQLMYARPQALCEARGRWWDWHERTCAQPIPLYMFTHRGPDGAEVKKLAPGDKTPKGPTLVTAATPTAIAPAPTAEPVKKP